MVGYTDRNSGFGLADRTTIVMKTSTLSGLIVIFMALFATTGILADERKSTMAADGSVILINPFTVPEGKLDEAIAMWEAGRDILKKQPGYISTKLHRSLSPDAQFPLINVAEWESVEAFKAATAKMWASKDFPRVDGVVPAPGLYKVIRN